MKALTLFYFLCMLVMELLNPRMLEAILEFYLFQFCREPSVRSMRQFLATVIFRLLGSRVVHEDVDISVNAVPSLSIREAESSSEVASAAFVDSSSGSLFDRLLLVLHGLLSSYPPSWLRAKPVSKTISEPTREFSGIDRELLEALQVCSFSPYVYNFWF